MKRIVFAFLALLSMQTALRAEERLYDEHANAQRAIETAVADAAAHGKKVLVVFGANWCGDCKMLDRASKAGALKTLLDRDYVTVKVDVGRFNRNVDVAERYRVPLKQGIPTIAVLDAKGVPTYVTTGGELADARSMGDAGIVAFFKRLP